MPLTPGARLGRYEILAPLGAGGMGEVYKATDTRLGRCVAIKVSREEFSARFEQEARAVAALNHPNICQIYDVGPNYLVMELVDGKPLRRPDDAGQLVATVSQIVDGLAAAHAAGVVHRDLKPDNILVTSDGQVKVLDFGLATGTADVLMTQTATTAGTVVGTVAYMSPEQASGEPVDARTDLWSLGVILYELAAGGRPFVGPTAAVVFDRILNQPMPALRDEAHVPSGLSPIIAKLLEKDRTRRYGSAGEVRAALQALVSGSSPTVREAPSIAVLPFANMSRDPDDEFLSDGLAEEIINLLAKVPGLKVTARTSAFAFRGRQEDIRTIASVLGVKAVLEGSVRRQGNRVRVTVQLINASDGYHLWSERYDRQMEDIFAVQDEIAAAITDALKVKLSLGQAPPERYQPNLHAYEAVLRGWHAYWQFTPEAIARSGAFFEEAMRLDPRFAQACSGYSAHLFAKVVFGFQSAHTAMPRIRQLSEQALLLDPTLAEAYATAAMVASQYEYDYARSETLFRQALACHTVPPLVRSWYGFWLLRITGPTPEGLELQREAIQEDPLNYILPFMYGITLTIAGRAEEGEEALRQAAALQPGFVAHLELALNLVAQGKVSDALRSSESAIALAPWSSYALGTLAGVTALAGDRARSDDALRRLAESQALDKAFGHTVAHVMRGELEAAAEWASRTIDQRLPWIAVLLAPFAAPLHESRWWPDLRRKLRLP